VVLSGSVKMANVGTSRTLVAGETAIARFIVFKELSGTMTPYSILLA